MGGGTQASVYYVTIAVLSRACSLRHVNTLVTHMPSGAWASRAHNPVCHGYPCILRDCLVTGFLGVGLCVHITKIAGRLVRTSPRICHTSHLTSVILISPHSPSLSSTEMKSHPHLRICRDGCQPLGRQPLVHAWGYVLLLKLSRPMPSLTLFTRALRSW